MASVALLFGLPSDVVFLQGWYTPAILGSISALLAIIFGYRYIKNKGENIVVVAGVAVAFIMLMLNIAFLLSFKVWQSIGF